VVAVKSWRELPLREREQARLEYENRTISQLRKDLVVAFDQIHDLKCRTRALKTKVWALTCAMGVAGGIIAWLSDHLYSCLESTKAVTLLLSKFRP
jgi:hypothetical protein